VTLTWVLLSTAQRVRPRPHHFQTIATGSGAEAARNPPRPGNGVRSEPTRGEVRNRKATNWRKLVSSGASRSRGLKTAAHARGRARPLEQVPRGRAACEMAGWRHANESRDSSPFLVVHDRCGALKAAVPSAAGALGIQRCAAVRKKKNGLTVTTSDGSQRLSIVSPNSPSSPHPSNSVLFYCSYSLLALRHPNFKAFSSSTSTIATFSWSGIRIGDAFRSPRFSRRHPLIPHLEARVVGLPSYNSTPEIRFVLVSLVLPTPRRLYNDPGDYTILFKSYLCRWILRRACRASPPNAAPPSTPIGY